nr:uncharacterized protein LOC112008959 [Quercus suber]
MCSVEYHSGNSLLLLMPVLTSRDNCNTDVQFFFTTKDIVMGISKTEVKLKRLLAAAPQQKNQAKLVHERVPEKKEEEETEGIGVREETNFGCKGCSQNAAFQDIVMGISKTEVKLKRLLAAAPQQKNQAKLVHYVATLREQLEQLAQERTSEGLPRVSKAVVNDFLEKIEAIASKLAAPLTTPDTQVSQEPLEETAINESPSKTGENHILPTPRLRRRFVPASNSEDRIHDTAEADSSAPVKLGAAAQAHIEKHRYLILPSKLLSIAWQALGVPMCEP